jgi:NAD(P)-dependent dehydrogenase (short-subunit alcohol dehydrogenase family)
MIIRKTTFDYTEEDWDQTLNVNLKSVFLCCKEVVPFMLRQGRGKIVNIASVAGHVGLPRTGGAYGVSKAGIINLTAHMAAELASSKINVNAVSPGTIQTPMTAPTILETPEKRQKIIERIPYGRLGEPDDIASAALFLASDQSDFVSGTVMVVDGGFLNHPSA